MPVLVAGVPPREWLLGPEGEAQARRLATELTQFQPVTLAASPEPKAQRTADIVGAALGVPVKTVDGLQEFDRPALPILPKDEHERLNAAIFREPLQPILGNESAQQALDRFTAAIDGVTRDVPPEHTLVVIAHGTVIALYVAKVRGDDAFTFWKGFDCASFVVL